MEDRQTADGLMDRMAPGRMEQPQPRAPAPTVSLTPGFQPSHLPQVSPMYTMQTKNAMIDDMGSVSLHISFNINYQQIKYIG